MAPKQLFAADKNMEEFVAVAARLRSVPEESRKLLTQIVELANSEPKAEREQDTAYVPEILESCGLDVDHMYALLGELERAKLVTLENQYPFETVKLQSGGLLRALWEACRQQQLSLRGVLVELRFEALGVDLHEQQEVSSDSAFLVRLGEDIRAARTRLGMTRKMLAQKSGVSERFLAQVESGSGNASVLVLRQIAAALHLSIAELLSEAPETANQP